MVMNDLELLDIYTVDLSWACCKYQHKCKGYKTHCGSSGVPSPFQMGHRVYWYHRSQLLNYYVCILCAIWNLYLSCGGGYISFSYIAMWKTFVNLPVLSFSPISSPPQTHLSSRRWITNILQWPVDLVSRTKRKCYVLALLAFKTGQTETE